MVFVSVYSLAVCIEVVIYPSARLAGKRDSELTSLHILALPHPISFQFFLLRPAPAPEPEQHHRLPRTFRPLSSFTVGRVSDAVYGIGL
jgi:hypothetical protein